MSRAVRLLLPALLLLAARAPAASEAGAGPHVPVLAILPFAGILLSIAVIPLVSSRWWHHNFPKVSLFWGLPTVAYIAWKLDPHWLLHTGLEYLAFITLLGSLFVISGGILLRGSIAGTPVVNTAILFIGSVLASFIGTTGASMLLIRPLLRANAWRTHRVHTVIFFIFLVSNIGGCLTPLGDPPLYLGFLKGVPFFWTFNLAPEWAIAAAVLLAIYFAWDSFLFRRERNERPPAGEPLRLVGATNFLFLLGVLGAVLLSSVITRYSEALGILVQVALMAAMAGLSLAATPRTYREENAFTWFPIKEVAILFAGIFACMIPALKLLEQRGAGLGVTEPWQFFWMTGILSTFLDNAPTYLTFLSLGKTLPPGEFMVRLLGGEGEVQDVVLRAISLGAVFMGANSYIGNGPNFMVKSVAEEGGVRMPTFFGYMAYSVGILIPIFLGITWIFF